MREAERRGVQHRARRRYRRLPVVSDVDRLPKQRMPSFAEMNTDLVLSAGRKLTLDQARAAQLFERSHVGDRALGVARRFAARAPKHAERAAQTIAAIAHEQGLEAL